MLDKNWLKIVRDILLIVLAFSMIVLGLLLGVVILIGVSTAREVLYWIGDSIRDFGFLGVLVFAIYVTARFVGRHDEKIIDTTANALIRDTLIQNITKDSSNRKQIQVHEPDVNTAPTLLPLNQIWDHLSDDPDG